MAPPAAVISIPSDVQVSLTTPYAVEQVIAGVIAVGLLGLASAAVAWRSRRSRRTGRWPGLWMGSDGRLSTSKALALGWTAVVAYCLLGLIFVVAAHRTGSVGTYLGRALHPLQGNYLALLGAPFGAYLAAKGIVANRVRRGQVQKSAGDGLHLADLVADDSGNVDLVDFQYTVFNLVAMLFVLTQFASHPGAGLPDIPAALAILTGASAGTYTTNKGLVTNPLALNKISPQVARPGDQVTVHGQNLYVPSVGDAAKPDRGVAVTVGGMAATVVPEQITPSRVVIKVPEPAPGTAWGTALDVELTSNTHRSAGLDTKLTVVQDLPRLRSLTPASGPVGSTVTVHGQYLQPPAGSGGDPTVTVRLAEGTTTVDAEATVVSDQSLTFEVPELPAAVAGPLIVQISVVRPTGVSQALPFTVTTTEQPPRKFRPRQKAPAGLPASHTQVPHAERPVGDEPGGS